MENMSRDEHDKHRRRHKRAARQYPALVVALALTALAASARNPMPERDFYCSVMPGEDGPGGVRSDSRHGDAQKADPGELHIWLLYSEAADRLGLRRFDEAVVETNRIHRNSGTGISYRVVKATPLRDIWFALGFRGRIRPARRASQEQGGIHLACEGTRGSPRQVAP
jgi:hypothetical protein